MDSTTKDMSGFTMNELERMQSSAYYHDIMNLMIHNYVNFVG